MIDALRRPPRPAVRPLAAPRRRQALSTAAWAYFAVVVGAATLASLPLMLEIRRGEEAWYTFVLLAAAASIAQLLSVHVGANRVFHPALVFVIAGIFLLPPELVVLLCVVQHGPEWLKQRYPWYIQTFNIANYVMSALMASAVWRLGSTRTLETVGLDAVAAGIAACVAFILVNRILLAVMLRLARGLSLSQTKLFTHDDLALELVLATMGLPLAAWWQHSPWLAPVSLAPLVLIHYTQTSSRRLEIASETIQQQKESLEEANRLLIERSTAAMEGLSAAVDARDEYTAGHSKRVRAIALALGSELGLEPAELETLGQSALLHDIGKIGVPDAVLLKPGRLSASEWIVMQSHAGEGARIIERLGFLPDAVAPIRHHHERMDGAGYPDGLRGDEIPLLARIIHLADALDSLVTTRVYRDAHPLDDAVAEIERCSGSDFCPRCVDALKRLVARDELPSFAELSLRRVA